MQDNDPKHTSRYALNLLKKVNWWAIHPESADANLTEKLWHELKEFITR